jgi:3-hydroxypropanoate dehydrogenase
VFDPLNSDAVAFQAPGGTIGRDTDKRRPVVTAADDSLLRAMFREARTFSYWQARPVPEGLVERAFALACFGPTSGNCQPMRLVLVRSPAAKERLLPCVSSGNYEKVRTAPVTAIVAYDREFFHLLPRLYPHSDARGWFTSNPALVEETGLRNSSLQGAYFILALRAQGLDCGPMSGFDADKVDAAFFANRRWRTNFLINIGYGDRDRLHPRLPRLGFDEVARWE